MLQPVAKIASNYGNQQEPIAAANKELGKDEFLLLLVQQLKYQDPLSPMDNQDFVAQMAQFSSLEQMQNMNENLADYLKVSALNDQRYQAVSMIGKDVTGFNASGNEVSGTVDAVRFDGGLPVLVIGKEELMFSQVSQVSRGSDE